MIATSPLHASSAKVDGSGTEIVLSFFVKMNGDLGFCPGKGRLIICSHA
jgi:hypothetical protein